MRQRGDTGHSLASRVGEIARRAQVPSEVAQRYHQCLDCAAQAILMAAGLAPPAS